MGSSQRREPVPAKIRRGAVAFLAALIAILGAIIPQTVVAQVTATATILASSSNPALVGAPVTFTATVLGSGPTGSVTFMDGADTLGTAALSGPWATITTSALAEGEHAITAVYEGDAGNGASASFVLRQVSNAYSNVIAMAAGGHHTAAVKTDGSVVAWGLNSYGQTVVPAAASSGVVGIATGRIHTVTLKNDGSVSAWGHSQYDQTTIPAAATSGVIAIAAGEFHTVALKNDGSAIAWGDNRSGQTTIPAAATSGVVAIAAGAKHTVALKSDGSVTAWGSNGWGQTTIPAAASSGVVAIAAATNYTMALKQSGAVIAWGYTSLTQMTVPASATSGVVAIAAGWDHAVALKSDGSVIAWGSNANGQTTIPASATSAAIAIAAGGYHSAALRSDGSAVAWGSNANGQASVPAFELTLEPSGAVPATEAVTFQGDAGGIDCTWDGSSSGGTLVSVKIIETTRIVLTATLPPNTYVGYWGTACDTTTANSCTVDSLSADTAISPVTVVDAVPPDAPRIVMAVAGDSQATIGFTVPPSNGGAEILWYTATSSTGQSAAGLSSPITVTGLTNGEAYTFTVTATNAAGTGAPSEPSESVVPLEAPVPPTGVLLSSSPNPALVGASVTFTATVTGNTPTGMVTFLDGPDTLGAVILIGPRAAFTTSDLNVGLHVITAVYQGDAGNGGSMSFPLSQAVHAYSNVIAVAAGRSHTAALKSDGSVVAWGANTYGQTIVPAVATSGVVAIAAGRDHTVALKSNGGVVAWGYNACGLTTIPAAATFGVVGIAAGGSFSLALKNDGSVIGWGCGGDGEISIPASAALGVIAIAAGEHHAVALKSDGSVIAWGNNIYGQTTILAAATSGVVAIAAGRDHTVALKSDGSVIAWGSNSYGQRTIPAAATSGVVAVAAGGSHTVALKRNGSVIVWGSSQTPPREATSGVIAIAAGTYHTVALKSDGTVVAWGYNWDGQTAVPAFQVTLEPSGPVTPGDSAEIQGDAGGIDCRWDGTSSSGACVSLRIIITTRVVLRASLPPNTFIDRWGSVCDAVTPTTCTIESLMADALVQPSLVVGAVPPGAPTEVLATAGEFQANVGFTEPTSDGGAGIMWYTATSSEGQSATGRSSPITVTGLTNGMAYTFTVTATNGAGTGPASEESNSVVPQSPTRTTLTSSANPALLGAPVTLTATVIGLSPTGTVTFKDGAETLGSAPLSGPRATFTTSALRAGQHSITAAYEGDAGSLGSTSLAFPQAVNAYSNVIAIAAGGGHRVALKSNGSVVAWGSNYYGQTTIPAAAASEVVAIAAGNGHTVALKSDGSVVAWGHNSSGQTTIPAAATSEVVAIAAGGDYTVALKSDGSVIAWGSGPTTIPPAAASGVIGISAGGYHAVALKADGSVIAWGSNNYGETTIPAAANSGVIAVSAGRYFTAALKSDGSVIAWGYNTYGQTTIPASAMSGVVAISAGRCHTVALKNDGSVVAWGYNCDGQTTVPDAAKSGVIAISAGDYYTLVLKSDGTVVDWADGLMTVPFFSVTVHPAGAVPAGETVSFSGDAGGIDCVWDGAATSGTCASVKLIRTTRVVLRATLPPNTFIAAWGTQCDSMTATTCTIESLMADTLVQPRIVVGAAPPDAPTIVLATAGDSSATVSFIAPPSHGGGIW